MSDVFAAAVSRFGASVKAKLGSAAVSGAPEDQLRAPIELLDSGNGSSSPPAAFAVALGDALSKDALRMNLGSDPCGLHESGSTAPQIPLHLSTATTNTWHPE